MLKHRGSTLFSLYNWQDEGWAHIQARKQAKMLLPQSKRAGREDTVPGHPLFPLFRETGILMKAGISHFYYSYRHFLKVQCPSITKCFTFGKLTSEHPIGMSAFPHSARAGSKLWAPGHPQCLIAGLLPCSLS